jgi:hypothetical protein
VEYEGRAQLRDDDHMVEVLVRIPDVEHPEWFAQVTGSVEDPVLRGEIVVTLLDGGIYNAWHGTALVRDPACHPMLIGIEPLAPPVGG